MLPYQSTGMHAKLKVAAEYWQYVLHNMERCQVAGQSGQVLLYYCYNFFLSLKLQKIDLYE